MRTDGQTDRQADRRTDMKKQILAFRNFANAAKISCSRVINCDICVSH